MDKVANVDRYDYDANGNQVVRNKGVVNQEQVLTWDDENRLAAVTYTNRTTTGSGGGQLPTTCNGVPCKRVFLPLVMQQTPAERYSYDADGARVRKETKTEVTRYIGPHFEVTVAITNGQVLTTTKYYDFGGQRIAVRQITPQTNTLSYLHGDHLGSTSVTTNNSGAQTSNVRYHAYGGQRSGNLFALPTDHTFTGQKLDKGSGLMYYGARYYDSALGTFVSPDTLIPDPNNPQDLNRYSYTRNNPLRYTDPTGHAWALPDNDGITTPVGILDPNRVRSEDERRSLFAWYDANPGYRPATDPVLSGETRAQPLDLGVTNGYLAMEYGFWQMYHGNASGADTIGAGLIATVVLIGTGTSAGGQGTNAGPVCLNRGTVKPDLARSSGRLRVDPDGVSTYCINCLKSGQTNAKPGDYWVKKYDAYADEALQTNLGLPEYTSQPPNGPGHFSVFRGGPTDETSSLWARLNTFIREAKTNFKYRGRQ